jgi:hypothetical protein
MSDNINIKGKKSFWQRPEGIPGAVVLIAIVGMLGYGLMQIMPSIIELAENMIYLGLMIGGVAAVAYVLMDKRVRTLAWYFYKSIIRKVTGAFIQLDPIAIIEGFLEDLNDKMGIMEEQIGSLKGQIRKIKTKIQDKQEKAEHFFGLAKAAQNKGDSALMHLNAKKAAREEKSMGSFVALRDRTEKLYLVLSKMKKYTVIMVDDITHEVEIKKEERETIRTSHKIMKSAVNIINGNSDRKLIFDQAMEYVVDDIGMRIGEMERFMDVSADFMSNMDLEQDMLEDQGMKAFDEWSSKIDEKFDADNYQSPLAMLEQGSVEFKKEKEKVKMTQVNTNTSSSNSNQKSGSKYF